MSRAGLEQRIFRKRGWAPALGSRKEEVLCLPRIARGILAGLQEVPSFIPFTMNFLACFLWWAFLVETLFTVSCRDSKRKRFCETMLTKSLARLSYCLQNFRFLV